MLTALKNTPQGLVSQAEFIKGSWINVIDPGPAELARLSELGIPHDYITYPLDQDERARMEREDGTLLLILRVPFFQGPGSDVPYITVPLGIILIQDYVITVCKHNNEILDALMNGRVKGLSTGKTQRFILHLMLLTANKYLEYLRLIDRSMDAIEDQLQKSTRNKEVLELLKIQKSLTYFTTALKSNELLMQRLQRIQLFHVYPEDEDLLEDVLTEFQQAIEMTSIVNNILTSTMDAFASIISNNLNIVMKFLASVTIVLSVPVMISSLFGMNVPVPFGNHPLGFLFILLISIGVLLPIIFLFRKQNWL